MPPSTQLCTDADALRTRALHPSATTPGFSPGSIERATAAGMDNAGMINSAALALHEAGNIFRQVAAVTEPADPMLALITDLTDTLD